MASKVAQRNASTATADVAEQAAEQEEAPRRRTATVNLPFVTAEFRAPEIHMPSLPVRAPDRSDLSGAVSAVRSRLPSPGQAAYYAGLGVLGVFELVEWPVVLAIGVGTAMTERMALRMAQRQGGPQQTESEQPSGEEATAK